MRRFWIVYKSIVVYLFALGFAFIVGVETLTTYLFVRKIEGAN